MARLLPWAVLLFGLVAAGGCKKPDSDLGLELIEARDSLGILHVDTVSLVIATRPEPQVRTSGLSRNILGSYLDRQFGVVRTGIVTQVRLSTNNVGQGQDNSGLVADSIVLSLAYDRLNYGYGNLNPQVFRVFELDQDLFIDTAYYNTDIPVVIPQDLVSGTRNQFRIKPFDSVTVGGVREVPQLRIPLDLSLGQRLLSRWGQSELVDNASFLDYFKGLFIIADNDDLLPYQNGALNFSLLSTASRLTLYYRNTLPGSEDTLSFTLLINDNSVRYTVGLQDHALAQVPQLGMALADSSSVTTETYVQSLGGLRTKVYMLHLMDLVETGPRALAKAELIVPISGTYFPYFPPPEVMFIFRTGEEGEDLLLPDQLFGQGVIGGTYSVDERGYRFNITRYIQGVLNGTYPNNAMSLVPGSSGVSVARTILAGPDHPENPMRLELTFTTY